jgi:hypothetical protein
MVRLMHVQNNVRVGAIPRLRLHGARQGRIILAADLLTKRFIVAGALFGCRVIYAAAILG